MDPIKFGLFKPLTAVQGTEGINGGTPSRSIQRTGEIPGGNPFAGEIPSYAPPVYDKGLAYNGVMTLTPGRGYNQAGSKLDISLDDYGKHLI